MTDYNPNSINMREPLFVDMFTNESPSDRIVIYKDDTHERKREHFYWESCMDKNGKHLPSPVYIKLKDLELAHLKRLCYFTLKGFPPYVNDLIVAEWNYRIDRGE
jgi:hypothetical protein